MCDLSKYPSCMDMLASDMYFRSLETASAFFVAKQNRVGDLGTKLTRLIVTRG